jgi:DNA-binding transcriptional ArsR family regulator
MADEGNGQKSNGRRRANLIWAMAHPLRRRILRLLRDRGEALSPVRASEDLDEPLGVVAYHMRVLWQFDAVEPAGEELVRGALKHFYESTIADDPPIEALLEETREFDEGEEK